MYLRSKHQTVCICRGPGGGNIEEARGGGWILEVLWTCCHHWRDEQYCYQRIFLEEKHQTPPVLIRVLVLTFQDETGADSEGDEVYQDCGGGGERGWLVKTQH